MAHWDVVEVSELRKSRLEEKLLLRMLASGELGDQDCARRQGSSKWIRLRTLRERLANRPAAPDPERNRGSSLLKAAAGPVPVETETPDEQDESWLVVEEDSFHPVPEPAAPPTPSPWKPNAEPEEPSDEFSSFLSRRRSDATDDLDLTAMVDVTFLLVLFFMLTATFSLQRSLEVPTPDPDEQQAAQAVQTLDDLRDDYIIVTIEADNTILVDEEKVPGDFRSVAGRIREVVRESDRNELIVYAADEAYNATVVRVLDAANDVGMQRIRLASTGISDPFAP